MTVACGGGMPLSSAAIAFADESDALESPAKRAWREWRSFSREMKAGGKMGSSPTQNGVPAQKKLAGNGLPSDPARGLHRAEPPEHHARVAQIREIAPEERHGSSAAHWRAAREDRRDCDLRAELAVEEERDAVGRLGRWLSVWGELEHGSIRRVRCHGGRDAPSLGERVHLRTGGGRGCGRMQCGGRGWG